MRKRKLDRCVKRQRGQFMTPPNLARDIVKTLDVSKFRRVLEPSCGTGSFISAFLDHVLASTGAAAFNAAAATIDSSTLYGVEIDSELHGQCQDAVSKYHRRGANCSCRIYNADFFRLFLDRGMSISGRIDNPLSEKFDLIFGNPPFGGSLPPDIEDELDARLGNRFGIKIKKETYAFFIVACTELLQPGGKLLFICSDSLLTIPTMTGLRRYLMESGHVTLHRLAEFSDETSYPMLVLEYVHGGAEESIFRFGEHLQKCEINETPNTSWGVTTESAKLFRGPKLGDFFVASSGMTTGKNEFFVRDIGADHAISEPYRFRFYDGPITVAYELERARLNKLPANRIRQLKAAEERGDVERRIAVEPLDTPIAITLPHEDYQPYNKAIGRIIYSPPTHVIYWKDNGDAVLTYKRTGNWYLRGVGGQPFFGREGLTWQLVASRFVPRYLPPGYIMDSGAPCAFTRPGVDQRELFFVIGWLLSPMAKHVLKTVINHTMNIQSKDFERMPYPWWVTEKRKGQATQRILEMISEAKEGRRWNWNDPEIESIGDLYAFVDNAELNPPNVRSPSRQMQQSLFS